MVSGARFLRGYRILLVALQLGRRLPKDIKKLIGIAVALLVVWVLMLIGLLVLLIIWMAR